MWSTNEVISLERCTQNVHKPAERSGAGPVFAWTCTTVQLIFCSRAPFCRAPPSYNSTPKERHANACIPRYRTCTIWARLQHPQKKHVDHRAHRSACLIPHRHQKKQPKKDKSQNEALAPSKVDRSRFARNGLDRRRPFLSTTRRPACGVGGIMRGVAIFGAGE